MKLYRYVCSFLGAISVLAGCKNTVPESASLAISSPKISGSQTYQIALYNSSVTLSGQCNTATSQLTLKTESDTEWSSHPPSLTYLPSEDLDCRNGDFSFTLASAEGLGFSLASNPGDEHRLWIRSEGDYGASNPIVITVRLAGAYNIWGASQSGGGLMTGSQYKILGKISPYGSTPALSSANYKIHLTGDNL